MFKWALLLGLSMLRMIETRSSLYSRIMPWFVFAAYDLIIPHFFCDAFVGSWFLRRRVFGLRTGGFSPKRSVCTSTNWMFWSWDCYEESYD